MASVTINGARVTGGQVVIPKKGIWHATLTIDDATPITGAVTIVLGNLTLFGTVAASGTYVGSSQVRVVGGDGGWNTTVNARAYQSDSGVRRSTVLKDAASDCGESVSASDYDPDVGDAFVRAEGPARNVLDLLAPDWYVANDGTTMLDPRPTGPVTGEHTVDHEDRAEKRFHVSTENPAAFAPGLTFRDQSLGSVTYQVGGDSFQVVAEYGETGDRFAQTLAAAVRRAVPELKFIGLHRYTIVSHSSDRYDLTPHSPSRGMPDLKNVKFAPGAAGASFEPKPGTLALVVFADSDPGQPYVIGLEPPTTVLGLPTETKLETDATSLTLGLVDTELSGGGGVSSLTLDLAEANLVAPIVRLGLSAIQRVVRDADAISIQPVATPGNVWPNPGTTDPVIVTVTINSPTGTVFA